MSTSITIWNVNGIEKTNMDELLKLNSDIICFGETKVGSFTEFPRIEPILEEYPYCSYNLCQTRRRYSGTCIYSKIEPICVYPTADFDDEGRVIIQEYDTFVLVHVYTPNSGRKLQRLEYRTEFWDNKFWELVGSIEKQVIVCGDLNIVPDNNFIWKNNNKAAGCTESERSSFRKHLERHHLSLAFQPVEKGFYSFWSTFGKQCRKENKGWLLDHFVKSKNVNVDNYEIHTDIEGSDHCPVTLRFI